MFLITRRANQANDAELKYGSPSRFLFKKSEEKQNNQGKPTKVATRFSGPAPFAPKAASINDFLRLTIPRSRVPFPQCLRTITESMELARPMPVAAT